MITIIAGSRDLVAAAPERERRNRGLAIAQRAVELSGFEITEVVSGRARGADTAGEDWALVNGVPCAMFPADWSLGKSAGHRRNCDMAAYAQALIAIWDGTSRGTKHMIETARKRGLHVFVYYPAKDTFERFEPEGSLF